jgi:Na+/H+ antiporter NhaD/arsenite permease-like protein
VEHPIPNPLMIIPFGALLLLVALGPLFFAKWWHHHYPKVAIALGAVTVAYYLVGFRAPARVVEVAHEYFSFISLIGSLFVVAGGIHITVKGEATPAENVIFLLFGAMIANFVGTTGASMLLIRPWIRMNKYRVTAHHIVFFIFLVSNLGGCLTPIGDPPLFIGFLKGVPFWWVIQHCWPMWLVVIGAVLAIFFVVDYRNYLRAPKSVRAAIAEPPDTWKFEGGVNVFLLLIILAAVFILKPMFVREFLMLGAAFASYYLTKPSIHEANEFNFEPVKEVAILFVGIFATMLPALDWLAANARTIAVGTPTFFYWGTGLLSASLDNAPTYYTFLIAAAGLFISPETLSQLEALARTNGANLAEFAAPIRHAFVTMQSTHPELLTGKTIDPDQLKVAFMLANDLPARCIAAISVSAVFFGAMTYIGNGPNFMVRSIAQHHKVHTPGFIGYLVKFALPYLLPPLALIWLIFFR